MLTGCKEQEKSPKHRKWTSGCSNACLVQSSEDTSGGWTDLIQVPMIIINLDFIHQVYSRVQKRHASIIAAVIGEWVNVKWWMRMRWSISLSKCKTVYQDLHPPTHRRRWKKHNPGVCWAEHQSDLWKFKKSVSTTLITWRIKSFAQWKVCLYIKHRCQSGISYQLTR